MPIAATSSASRSFLMEHIKQSAEKSKQQRMVRIFLSSTYTDMFEEREEIMRNLMVQLSAFCYDRGVTLTYVDMRWGNIWFSSFMSALPFFNKESRVKWIGRPFLGCYKR